MADAEARRDYFDAVTNNDELMGTKYGQLNLCEVIQSPERALAMVKFMADKTQSSKWGFDCEGFNLTTSQLMNG